MANTAPQSFVFEFRYFYDGGLGREHRCYSDGRSLTEELTPRSSSGLGRWPFTPVTRVQIPYGVQNRDRMGCSHPCGLGVLTRRVGWAPADAPSREVQLLAILQRQLLPPASRFAGSVARRRDFGTGTIEPNNLQHRALYASCPLSSSWSTSAQRRRIWLCSSIECNLGESHL